MAHDGYDRGYLPRRMVLLGVAALLFVGGPAGTNAQEDPWVIRAAAPAENRTPVFSHPQQQAAAARKLAELQARTGKRPNILILLMDDVGWGDPGCYGGGAAIGAPTPTMDRLARQGLMLTSTYAQPSCSPTRATILTGRLPVRHGILWPPMYGEEGGLSGEVTLAQLLSDAGYVTQAVGKWHLGENEESLPHNVGFDDFYGFLSVSDMYTEWRDDAFFPEVVTSPERTAMIESFPFDRHLVHATKGGTLEDLAEITLPVSATLDETWADYSVKFLESMAESDRPFFLYHCTRGAHFDNYPNERFKGRSPSRHPYKDVMIELDDILARLVSTLEATGQLENTLVFVTSDNGPEMETWPDSGHTPFRGAKGSTWEGGVRVPGIVYFKDVIEPGRVSDGLFDLADLFTTSVALAGALGSLPSDRFIDGVDQTSFLLADDGESNRQVVYYWQMQHLSAVRMGEFKLMIASVSDDDRDTSNSGGFSGVLQRYAAPRLYNLYTDPKEMHSYLIRKLVYVNTLRDLLKQHMATFMRYPPKHPIGRPDV